MRKKKAVRKTKKKDRISELTDDILIRILSLLKLKEAQATSVLSKRWRYLWTHRTCLDFTVDRGNPPNRRAFKAWVNNVCSSIQSPSIEQFIIDYKSCVVAEEYIDEWVGFALGKGVKNLEICMSTFNWTLSRLPVSSGFKHLQSLSLKYIGISDEVVEHFLLHCSSLEQISIEKSDYLRRLKVGGPFCNLKVLKLIENDYLQELQLSAPKLSSFFYEGAEFNLIIGNVSLLSHVSFCSYACLNWAFPALATPLSQIRTLELYLNCTFPAGCEYPILSNLSSLRELMARLSESDNENLIDLFSFLKASPFLEKFKVTVITIETNGGTSLQEETELADSQEEMNLLLTPHQHLKVFEVANFVNHPMTVEFVKLLYKLAHKLEKVIIDPMPLGTSPSHARTLFTNQFEELFDEVIRPGIDQRTEFVLNMD